MPKNLTFDQRFNMMESADLSLAGWTRNMIIIVTAGVAIQQFHKSSKGVAYLKISNIKIPLLSLGAFLLILSGLLIGTMANWFYFKKIDLVHPPKEHPQKGIDLEKYYNEIIQMQYDYKYIGNITSLIIVIYLFIFIIIIYEFHKKHII